CLRCAGRRIRRALHQPVVRARSGSGPRGAGRRLLMRRLLLCALMALAPAATQAQTPDASPAEAISDQIFGPRVEADYAFGAFQRGYFLTALELALPRAEQGDAAAQTLI